MKNILEEAATSKEVHNNYPLLTTWIRCLARNMYNLQLIRSSKNIKVRMASVIQKILLLLRVKAKLHQILFKFFLKSDLMINQTSFYLRFFKQKRNWFEWYLKRMGFVIQILTIGIFYGHVLPLSKSHSSMRISMKTKRLTTL